jgi:amidohydrolase family protein
LVHWQDRQANLPVLVLYSTPAKAPVLEGEDKKTSTRRFLRELNRFGLTSAIDAAGGFQNFPDNYETVVELAKAGQLSLRIAYHLFPQTPGQEIDDLARWIETARPRTATHGCVSMERVKISPGRPQISRNSPNRAQNSRPTTRRSSKRRNVCSWRTDGDSGSTPRTTRPSA